jgi:hypothetical protein
MPIEDCAADAAASLIGLEMPAALAALSISTAAALDSRSADACSVLVPLDSVAAGSPLLPLDSVAAAAALAALDSLSDDAGSPLLPLDSVAAAAALAALEALDASTATAVLAKHIALNPLSSRAMLHALGTFSMLFGFTNGNVTMACNNATRRAVLDASYAADIHFDPIV